jgi:hypothetical protein
MDQCSKRDTPSAIPVNLTNRPGHALIKELNALAERNAPGQRLGDSLIYLGETIQHH